MNEKIVYLMRGLPSCGKSHTAKKLAGETGVICETDEYFYSKIGEDPKKYDYRKELMDEARQWNFERFKNAVDEGKTPIVVDRGNSLSVNSQIYARYAVDHGYTLQLKEPESVWWQELRVLLKYKHYTKAVLDTWAVRLAAVSKATHRVSASTIRRRMDGWKYDLTVEDILSYDPKKAEAQRNRNGAFKVKLAPEQSINGQFRSLSGSNPWVGNFLLNLAEDEGMRNPNKNIQVAVGPT